MLTDRHSRSRGWFIVAAALVAALLGLLVLIGWVADARFLENLGPVRATMKTNAALAVVLAGLSLGALAGAARRRSPQRLLGPVCAIGTLSIAALTFMLHAFAVDLGVDQLLFSNSSPPPASGRMSKPAATGFLLLGVSLLLLHAGRGPRVAQGIALLALLVSGFFCLGYLYRGPEFASFGPFGPIAVPTALALFVLSLGTLAASSNTGLVGLLTGDGASSRTARLLIPAAVLVPVAASYARLEGQRAGWYDAEVGLALFTLANVIALAGLVWWSESRIQRSENRLRQADDSLRESEQRFRGVLEGVPHLVWTARPDGAGDFMSLQWVAYTGRPEPENLGSGWLGAVHPDDLGRVTASWQRSVTTRGVFENECRIRSAEGEYRWFRAQAVWVADGDGGKWFGTNTEIHDKKRAEEQVRELTANLERRVAERTAALHESEERYRLAILATNDAVWDIDVTNGTVHWSEKYTSVLGRPPETADSWQWWIDRIHPDDRDRTAGSLRSAVDGTAEAWASEYRFLLPNGEWAEIRDRAYIARDPAGKAVRVVGAMQDVTAFRRASAERDRMWNRSLDPMCVAGFDGYFKQVNPAWEQVLGWTAGELTSRPWLDFVHPDDQQATRDVAGELVGGELLHLFENRYQHRDGTYRWLSWKAYPAVERQIIFAIARDVTDIKRAEAALRESEERFRTYIEKAPVGVFVVDAAGRYVDVNPAACRISGYDREELLQLGVGALTPPEARSASRPTFDRIKSDGVVEIDWQVRRKSGEVRQTTLAAVRLSGNEVMGFLTDVTERKQAEAALRASEERLRLFIENVPTGVAMFDREMRYLSYSRRWLADYNLGDQNLHGRSHYDIFPETPDRWKDVHKRCLSGAAERCEIDRFDRADGTPIYLRWAVQPWYEANGAVGGLVFFGEVITDRMQAELSLKASEERLRMALNAGRMGIFDWDLATNAVVWSDTHYELFGYPLGEQFPVEYHHFADRVHPDDLPAVEQAIRTAMEQHTTYKSEHRLLLPDGVVRWNLGTGEFQYASDGRPVRMLGTVSDITARKQAEESLLASEARARAVINSSPVPMALNDDAQRITFLNLAFTRTFGYELADIPTLADWWPKAYPDPAYQQWVAEAWQAELTRSAQTGTAFAIMDLTIRCKDGTDRFVEANATALADAFAGTHLVVLHDITDRKRAEAGLVVRDRAIQAVNQGIVITDPTRPDNPIVYVSPGFERLTGYSSTEVVGRNCRFLQGPETDKFEIARVAEAIRAVQPCAAELLNYRKDGSTFWNELSITPVRNPAGRLVHFIGIETDVTARRSLEEQLRQAQKMEAVGQLAGGVAHDFNNLLTVINGYSDLLLTDLSPEHPLRDPLGGIREAGERAASLTQQLLAFSRRSIVAPRVLDVNDLVGSGTKMLRRLIGEDVALATVLSPTPCRVRIDPGQLEQAIMNLAVNARDAMPKGGRLTIETNHEQVLTATPDCPPARYVRLAITDTGCGMTDELKARIFEPFFTTKGVGKGTGLGLAMVYGIVRQAGGCVRAESVIGRGTTFTLMLPEVPAGAAEQPTDGAARIAPRGSETVLLAEDEEGVRKLSRLVLETQGYTVLATESGAAAASAAASYPGPIHLLVTDVVMPDLGGRELADAVRAIRPTVRVLYVSGYTNDALVRHGVEEEVDAFLQKPFTPLTLARKVREVLDAPRPE